MKPRLGIIPKLALIFVLFAAALLAGLGGLAYRSGRTAMQTTAISELLSTAIEKQAALDAWVAERQHTIGDIANQTNLREAVITLINAAPDSPEARRTYDELVENLRNWAGEGHRFLNLDVIDAATGRVIAATNASEEGKSRADQPYFINGRQAAYVQNPSYDLARGGPSMTAAAPIFGLPVSSWNPERSEGANEGEGGALAVLAGPLNLEEMNSIVQRRTGLRQTDDAYLVNTASLYVTQPRFVADPAVLQRGIQTEAVERCLAHADGMLLYDNHRGVPVIGVYRWLPKRQLCLIVEIDQVEAFAPAQALGKEIARFAGAALLFASALAYWLARTITGPVHELVKGAAEIGQGNLDYRIAGRRRDELGRLAGAFNEMAANLAGSVGEVARGQRLLAALSQAAQAVQHARTPEEVYHAVGDEMVRLGFHAVVLALTEDRDHLRVAYLSFDSPLIQAAEKLTGLSARSYRIPLMEDGIYRRVVTTREPAYVASGAELAAQALPAGIRPLASRLLTLLGSYQAIYAPLIIAGEVYGLLGITGSGLTEADVPAISVFANQASIAMENARLYQEIRAWATELERRVEERTAALHRSEKKYRTLVENIPQKIFTKDRNSVYVSCNENFARDLGITPEAFAGKTDYDFFPKDLADHYRADDKRVLDSGKTERIEEKYIQHGREVWVETIKTPIQDEQGNGIGVLGIFWDITERKRAEEMLRENESRLREAQALGRIGNWEFDVHSQTLQWSEQVFNLYERDPALGPPSAKEEAAYYSPEQAQQLREYARRAIEGGQGFEYDLEARLPSGRIAYFTASMRPLKDEKARVVRLFGTVQDITARKQTEEDLRRRTREAETLREAAAVVASTLDQECAVQLILDQLARVVPYDSASIQILEDDYLEIVGGRGWPDPAIVLGMRFPLSGDNPNADVVKQRRPHILGNAAEPYPTFLQTPHSHIRSWLGVPMIVRDQVIGLLAIDSSQPDFYTEEHARLASAFANQAAVAIENARLYDAVRGHAAELEQKVNARTAELTQREADLRAANDKLKELDQLKSQFVSNVSHELRTPLTNIMMHLHLAQRGKPERREQYMQTMQNETLLLQRLIEDLLDLSRLDQGRARFDRTPLDVNQMLAMLVDARGLLVSQRGLTLEVHAEPGLPVVLADAQMLMQVLTNLLTNAVNYTPSGGVVTLRTGLRISDCRLQIEDADSSLKSEIENLKWVVFSVADTGLGITPQDQARIFERFYRGEAARQIGVAGTGLGLSICQEIIARHGGKITVESQVGVGSTFTAWLPVEGR